MVLREVQHFCCMRGRHEPTQRLLPRVLTSIQSAKASHAQLSDMPLRSDTQALRLTASAPLIQRREKCPSREGKSASPQWFSSVYVRSLKDQARKSKYPRTQILEPRTQTKLICHASTTFIPTRSNNPIVVTSQSYIGIQVKLYSNQSKAIQLHLRTHAPIYGAIAQAHLFITRTFFLKKSEALG